MDSLKDSDFVGKCCRANRIIFLNSNYDLPKKSIVIVLEIKHNIEYSIYKTVKLLFDGKVDYFSTSYELNYWLEKL